MKKFSDLGVTASEDKNIFNVPVISIEDVANIEIEVLDFEANVKTGYGEGRYILKVKYEGRECKFFTNADPIKKALEQINKSDFPFITTIKPLKFGGNKKTYQFT